MLHIDLLTKLNNRQQLINDIRKSDYQKLALVNVTNFYEITTIYGLNTGDSLLITCSDIIKIFSESKGFKAYKIKPSVFAVLAANDITDNNFVESIIDLKEFLYNNTTYKCLNTNEIIDVTTRASIVIKEEGKILEKAEMALQYAEIHNLDFQIYHNLLDITEEYKNQLTWIRKINDAIKEDRIVPYYQPIYKNETSKLDHYEALIRMIDRNGEVIPPYFFLEIARKAGLYSKLSRIIIGKVFEKFRGTNKHVSINLLFEDIKNKETRQLILNGLKDKSLGKYVIFEIVEMEEIEDFETIITFIKQIRELGAQVAIDDFGAGYSNFRYLTKLNVDYIKIDGLIIKNICNDAASEHIAQAITDISNKLGAKVIAEFVENESISNKIKKMGITYSQGYYYSIPKEDIDFK